MAQGVGSAKQILGADDVFGGRLYGIVDYSGPASYVPGGDAIDPRIFGFPNAVLTLIGGVDQSNTYFVLGRAMANGNSAFQLVWYLKAGGEVAATTNLSGVTVRLSAIGI